MTLSAVKGEPSWKVTPRRSLNSQVLSSTVFHDSASAGCGLLSGSICTSVSKMWLAICWFGVDTNQLG
jgi:hypothetical protein